jgi:hypothetical protein
MKHVLVAAAALLFSTSAMAERVWELNTGRHVQVFPHRNRSARHGFSGGNNLIYWNGPVLHQAKVVPVFWGPAATWGTNGAPSALAQTLLNFFAQFGTNPEYNVITQYYDFAGSVRLTNLLSRYWIDNSTPPTNVTDAALQGEVVRAIAQVGLDTSTVYEVFLPPTSYASISVYDSCGGPNLTFCAYHGNFSYGGADIKYASLPYPSCGGCRWSSWTMAQNFEHFACHETREAATDPDGNAWFDRQGNEADDKCAWSPSPFLVNGYGYQYEWSNLAQGCVQSR